MREGEEKFRIAEQIVREAQDAIIMADREGIIRLWNKGAETIFGFSSAEAMGQSLRIIIPEKLRERHEHGYREVMQSGRSRYARELLAVPGPEKGWGPDIGGIHHNLDTGPAGAHNGSGGHPAGCFGAVGNRPG
jgi:PAS domain S-box-containing protein